MKHRKLRIAWSMAWGIVAVMLVALWVRSYWWTDFLMPSSRTGVVSSTGSLLYLYDSPVDWPLGWTSIRSHGDLVEATRSEALSVIIVKCWWLILGTLLLASSPWLLRKRFTTRTLLIATTLVALGLGLIVWLR